VLGLGNTRDLDEASNQAGSSVNAVVPGVLACLEVDLAVLPIEIGVGPVSNLNRSVGVVVGIWRKRTGGSPDCAHVGEEGADLLSAREPFNLAHGFGELRIEFDQPLPPGQKPTSGDQVPKCRVTCHDALLQCQRGAEMHTTTTTELNLSTRSGQPLQSRATVLLRGSLG
jgi:hypothetical protein